MIVRLLKTPHMIWSGHPWPPVGETVAVPERIAHELIQRGEAVEVKEQSVIESAEAAPPERAARTTKPKTRK